MLSSLHYIQRYYIRDFLIDFLIKTVEEKQLVAQQHEPDRKVRRMDAVKLSYDSETDCAATFLKKAKELGAR